MNRVVYLGGAANGQQTAERTGAAIERVVGAPVDAFTFRWSADPKNALQLAKAVKDALVVTHSGGMTPLEGTSPEKIISYGAPLPTSVWHLLKGSVIKTARLQNPNNVPNFRAAMRVNNDSAAELIKHPYGNLRHLGAIARFNAIDVAAHAQASGIPTELIYTSDDVYFQPTVGQQADAAERGVPLTITMGEHDELLFYPDMMLRQATLLEV